MNTNKHPIYINVRGCNGSGKTSLLRRLAARSSFCEVVPLFQPVYPEDQDKAGKRRGALVEATVLDNGVAIVGNYSPENSGCTTAGLDRIATQADAKKAALLAGQLPGIRAVIFEGIIVSTIYQGWRDFSGEVARLTGRGMIWAFLETPLDECLTRISRRNGGKPIDESLVRDKHRSIRRVYEKAAADGALIWAIEDGSERIVDESFAALLEDELNLHFNTQA